MTSAADLIATATTLGATVVRSPGATIIVIPDAAATGDDRLSLDEAAREAKCSVLTLRRAARRGEIPLFGTQRSRTVKRSDLAAWIESRRARPSEGADDDDMDRRFKRHLRAVG